MGEPLLRGSKPWLRGRDREVRGVERERMLEGCVSDHGVGAHVEKIGLWKVTLTVRVLEFLF